MLWNAVGSKVRSYSKSCPHELEFVAGIKGSLPTSVQRYNQTFFLFSYGDLVFVKDVSGTKFCEGYLIHMSHKFSDLPTALQGKSGVDDDWK